MIKLQIRPEGFNNTIRWHIGHVLTATEVFMFGKEFKQLPTEYPGMFGYGSRPSKWKTEGPSLEVLTTQLKNKQSVLTKCQQKHLKINYQSRF